MRPKIYIEEGYLETFELKLKEALSNNSIKQDQYEELLNRLKLQIVITKSKAEVKYKGNKNNYLIINSIKTIPPILGQ